MSTILVIDDSMATRDLLSELFSKQHVCHTTDSAENALVGLEMMSYDVVITDLLLPEMSGLEFIRRVRRSNPLTPIIVISGIDLEHYDRELKDLGVFDHFVKPFHLNEIEESVGRALLNPGPKCKSHVLIVDDAPDVTDMIAAMLGTAGYRPSKAFSGIEALEAANDELFDMVISDIAMPKMDGYELAARLRELPSYRDVPMIAMTGFPSHDSHSRASAAGFNAHLSKPITPSVLLDVVTRLCGARGASIS